MRQREQVLDSIEKVSGWLTRNEADALVTLAENVPREQVIVEIGSYRGRSTIALAAGAIRGNGNSVYAIDPHRSFVGPNGGKFGPPDRQAFYENIGNLQLGDMVALVGLDSEKVVAAWGERNVGMIWIDGDHNEDAVRKDLSRWQQWMPTGALAVFHDINLEGVSRVIEEAVENRQLSRVGVVDNLAWLRNEIADA